MKIYVAAPYSSGDPAVVQANVDRAFDVAAQLILKGHNPFVPHAMHYVALAVRQHNATVGYERWMELDAEWLALCEGFFFVAPSPGANTELLDAACQGKQVFTHLDQVPEL